MNNEEAIGTLKKLHASGMLGFPQITALDKAISALSAKPEPCCGECALCKGGKGFGEKYGGAIGSDPIPCPRCNETGKEPAKLPEVEAKKFLGYYGSNDWKVGKNKMKSWKHAVAGWAARMPPVEQVLGFEQRHGSTDWADDIINQGRLT
jgi:hypothetical protein